MIVEFGRDLQSFQHDINRSLEVVAPLSEGIVKNWQALSESHRRAERGLLNTVEASLAKNLVGVVSASVQGFFHGG